jgi:hypothetical protein
MLTKKVYSGEGRVQSLRAIGVMSDHGACATKPTISACAHSQFEASLEQEQI